MEWVNRIIEWISRNSSLLALVIQALMVGVLFWTLRWVRRYTLAAEEQVEALHRPYLSIVWELMDRGNLVYAALTAEQGEPIPRCIVPEDGLIITNIGAGPAINMVYTLKDKDTGQALTAFPGRIPRLDINSPPFKTLRWNSLVTHERCQFVMTYETLRGVKYETKVPILRRETVNHGWEFVILESQTTRV